MTLRKFRENLMRDLMIGSLVSIFLMIICAVFLLITFTPTMESVRDYIKEGRLTMFALGVTVGMSLASLLALYFVNLQAAEEEKSVLARGVDVSRGTRSTPRALRAVPKKEDDFSGKS